MFVRLIDAYRITILAMAIRLIDAKENNNLH